MTTEAAIVIYEIINPSDPCTLAASDFTVAGVAAAILGQGKLGLCGPDGNPSTPILFGWDEWFAERGITDLMAYLDEHRAELAAVLESVMLGSVADRADLDAMLAEIPADRRENWIKARNDRRRSSMNDIEGRAHEWAKRLRAATA